MELGRSTIGAGNETRTRDLNLGKVALYQLSYSRAKQRRNCRAAHAGVKKNSAHIGAKTLNYGIFLQSQARRSIAAGPQLVNRSGPNGRRYRLELPRSSGQARRRYAIIDHSVSTTATAVNKSPSL
jgi:hypothetical protein